MTASPIEWGTIVLLVARDLRRVAARHLGAGSPGREIKPALAVRVAD